MFFFSFLLYYIRSQGWVESLWHAITESWKIFSPSVMVGYFLLFNLSWRFYGWRLPLFFFSPTIESIPERLGTWWWPFFRKRAHGPVFLSIDGVFMGVGFLCFFPPKIESIGERRGTWWWPFFRKRTHGTVFLQLCRLSCFLWDMVSSNGVCFSC